MNRKNTEKELRETWFRATFSANRLRKSKISAKDIFLLICLFMTYNLGIILGLGLGITLVFIWNEMCVSINPGFSILPAFQAGITWICSHMYISLTVLMFTYIAGFIFLAKNFYKTRAKSMEPNVVVK